MRRAQVDEHHLVSLRNLLDQGVPFVFSATDGSTEYEVLITPAARVMSRKYGNSSGRVWVSVVYKGAFHFDFSKRIYEDYVAEKLNLPPADAEWFADLLNLLGPFPATCRDIGETS